MEEKEIQKIQPHFKKYKARIPILLFPWTSGMLSTMTTLFIKCVAELFQGESILYIISHPMIYICLLFVVCTLVGQLYTLNTGIKYYNQLEVVPIYMSSVIINNIICGGVIYNEFASYLWW